MKILGIETSSGDTGIAILEVSKNRRFKVLADVVASQIQIHQKYGGVYPALAKREHQRDLVPALAEALKGSRALAENSSVFFAAAKNTDINLIAITNGPGLEPCLWTGVNFAKNLAKKWNVPVVAVNHIEAHILVNLLGRPNRVHGARNSSECEPDTTLFPAIALVVSGGHTQIILVKKIGDYKILGETRDDAAGECFDKCAKILGLGYPGGPAISKIAGEAHKNSNHIGLGPELPRPMINTKDYDFSFSGLKTAVLYSWQKNKQKQNGKFFASRRKTSLIQAAFAAEVQQAIIDVLIKKTIKAAKDYKARTIILGGGVSANDELRKHFIENCKLKIKNCSLLFPPKNLSTDNGLMVAVAGYFKAKENKFTRWQDLEANANLRVE